MRNLMLKSVESLEVVENTYLRLVSAGPMECAVFLGGVWMAQRPKDRLLLSYDSQHLGLLSSDTTLMQICCTKPYMGTVLERKFMALYVLQKALICHKLEM